MQEMYELYSVLSCLPFATLVNVVDSACECLGVFVFGWLASRVELRRGEEFTVRFTLL